MKLTTMQTLLVSSIVLNNKSLVFKKCLKWEDPITRKAFFGPKLKRVCIICFVLGFECMVKIFYTLGLCVNNV